MNKKSESIFTSFDLFIYNEKMYIEYAMGDDTIHLGKDGKKTSVYSYNMKTGEMKKTSIRREDALVPYRWCAHSRTEFGEELRGGYGG